MKLPGILSKPSRAQLHKSGGRISSSFQKPLLKQPPSTYESQAQKPRSGCDRSFFLVASNTHSQQLCPLWADTPSLCSNSIQAVWPCKTNPAPLALWVGPFMRHFLFNHPMPPRQRAHLPCTSPAFSPHVLGCPCYKSYRFRSFLYLDQSQLSLQKRIFLFVLCDQTHIST